MNGRLGMVLTIAAMLSGVGQPVLAQDKPAPIGPEVTYLSGEFDASNLTVTANMTFDIVRDDGRRRVVPYLAAGGGYLRQKTLVGSGPGSTSLVPFTSSEGTMSAGVGARIALGSHMFVAPEFRLGWEPETRIAVTIGMRFR